MELGLCLSDFLTILDDMEYRALIKQTEVIFLSLSNSQCLCYDGDFGDGSLQLSMHESFKMGTENGELGILSRGPTELM